MNNIEQTIGRDFFVKKNEERRKEAQGAMSWVDRAVSGLPPLLRDEGVREEIYGFGRRIGAEMAGAAEGAVLGGRYGQQLGPHGRLLGMALGGAAGALTGKRLDELFGNMRPDEIGLFNDFVTAAGGTLAAKVPKLYSSERAILDNIFSGRGISKTPGMISDSSIVQAMEQRLRELPGSAGIMNRSVDQTYSDFENAINFLLDDSTLRFEGASAVGDAIKSGAKSKIQAFTEREDALFRATSIIGRDAPVQPSALANFVQDYSGRFDNPAFKALQDNPEIKKIMEAIFDSNGNLMPQTWGDMELVRKSIGQKMQYGSGSDIGLMKQVYKALMEDMDSAASNFDGAAKRAWQKARQYSAQTRFARSEQLAKIAEAKPESLWRKLVSGAGNRTEINQLKRAVDRDTWEAIRAEVIRFGGRDMSNPQAPFFNPRLFLSSFRKIAQQDQRAAKDLFGPIYGDLRSLAAVAHRINLPQRFGNPSGTGRANLLNNLFMAGTGAGGGIAVFNPIAGAATAASILITPRAMAKIWTSPKLVKWMKAGTELEMGSPKVRAAYARAGATLMLDEAIDEEQIAAIVEHIMGASPNMQQGQYDDVPTIPTQ